MVEQISVGGKHLELQRVECGVESTNGEIALARFELELDSDFVSGTIVLDWSSVGPTSRGIFLRMRVVLAGPWTRFLNS